MLSIVTRDQETPSISTTAPRGVPDLSRSVIESAYRPHPPPAIGGQLGPPEMKTTKLPQIQFYLLSIDMIRRFYFHFIYLFMFLLPLLCSAVYKSWLK